MLNSNKLITSCAVALLGLLVAFAAEAAPITPQVFRQQAVSNAVASAERLWKKLDAPPDSLGCREVMMAALAWCEANTNLNRLEKLFEVAATMQDRNPTNRGYGNLRWSWGHAEVFDFNAVDFTMQTAAMIWIHHRDKLPTGARTRLKELMDFGIEGLKRHRVTESYTNIALMNAGNLIMLGEAFGLPAVAEEGYARLDRILTTMWEMGTHEYDSPTYYGVDLEDLALIEAFCQRERGRAQARALLEYFWTDISLNWFAGSRKLGGTRSRDYDYLAGLGVLDQHLLSAGWLDASDNTKPNNLYCIYTRWQPTPALRNLALAKTPRLVEQVWGVEKYQARVNYVCPDVSLSASGASYGGRMDLPLTVDLPGERKRSRGYFISDARQDPYGKIKIAESKAHAKTLHLNPFWTATQRRVDALGLVAYREKDLNPTNDTLQSHFVLPLDVDAILVNGQAVKLSPKKPAEYPLAPGAALIVRQGTAAVGIRVPWARALDGKPSSASLVYDGNSYGAMRLTVNHHTAAVKQFAGTIAAAAFWVRIGSGLDQAQFERWQKDFSTAKFQNEINANAVTISVTGVDGPLTVAAAAPYSAPRSLVPGYSRALLAHNGKDLGRALLQAIEPVKTLMASRPEIVPIPLSASGTVRWEAEAGRLMSPMSLGRDPQASGGAFAWMPAQPGEKAGSSTGYASYTLHVAKAGEYILWGRVLAPTPENDSFIVRVEKEGESILENTSWPVGTHKQWEWVRFNGESGRNALALKLPAGEVTLQIRVREAGTKMDRLYLTNNREETPK